MMACRRLARDAVAASLRRSAATETTASTPAFFSSSSAAASSCSSGAPVAGSPIRHFLARYSSPAFQIQPSAAGLGPSFAARVALGLRPQLSGLNLIKGFGTSTMLAMTLHQGQVTAATKEQPSKAIAGPPQGSLKTKLGSFWPLLHHREVGQNHAVSKEEYMRTRNIITEDYKFFSIGTIELVDGRVLHLIGMLGSWWIYRVSFKCKELV
ncbi:Adenine nucleotide alpha hydrolase-like superfamily protein [Zea mays]|uniref:Adenine nucleotide alpha hydrolase-like superfamily protein n=1 Tax=Zea mays TaxID=4577 RepID=A0A1D6FEU5_MAIZE|nr:Adenine nucleotide alpha hydrolase-like superfamily protein [Zea mays]